MDVSLDENNNVPRSFSRVVTTKSLDTAEGETLQVVVKRKKTRRPFCYMKSCHGATVAHVKKHIVGKHLPRSFRLWNVMDINERLRSLDAMIQSVLKALNLSSTDELLVLVGERKWFPEGTNFMMSDEEERLVKEFHRWSTGHTLDLTPTMDPPNCVAVFTHWRAMSTLINCVGEEKVALVEPDVEELEIVRPSAQSSPDQRVQSAAEPVLEVLPDESGLLGSAKEDDGASVRSSILDTSPAQSMSVLGS